MVPSPKVLRSEAKEFVCKISEPFLLSNPNNPIGTSVFLWGTEKNANVKIIPSVLNNPTGFNQNLEQWLAPSKCSIVICFVSGWIWSSLKCKVQCGKSGSPFFFVKAANLIEYRVIDCLCLSETIKITTPIFHSWWLAIVRAELAAVRVAKV